MDTISTLAAITIVSGLPRSGTSLLMQMLDQGGQEVISDQIRQADTDNPRGYYEYETVKKIKQDASWLPNTRGKAFKMISQLLYDLPASETYRIIFMERDLDEVLRSQEKMLERLNRPIAPREQIKAAFISHLARLHEWLDAQRHMSILRVNFNELVQQPLRNAERVAQFLGTHLRPDLMALAVDPDLYRNRKHAAN